MKDLNKLRDEINSLDQKMKELFLRRMDIVKDIYSYKKEHELPIYDKTREEEMIKNLLLDIDESLKDYYLKFIKLILDTSKEYQNKLKEKEGK